MSTRSAKPKILLTGPRVTRAYGPALTAALAARGIAAEIGPDLPPETVDYIVYDPGSDLRDFTPFTRARAVLSIWAGVEKIIGNPTLTQPLARMVDPVMTRGMTEYVMAHVLRHHIGMDAHIRGLNGEWRQDLPKLAPERRVTVLGLGELGATVARALAGIGFDVTGWSRSARAIPELSRCLSGPEGLATALDGAEILILLVPYTPATENLIDAARLARLAPGAVLINPGRGPLLDDGAVLSALDSGRLGHATLDVFRIEPLPADHTYWAHPRVTVTPHVAAETRPESASRVLADNIARVEAGLPLLNQVDRDLGY